MTDRQQYTLTDLPEGLRRQFEKVERRLWRIETATAVCAVVASLAFSLLAVFVSDRLWATPSWLRMFFLLCGLAGAVAAGLSWARHWVWKRRDIRALASLVQKRYRRLGDRLLGIVELANEREHTADFSPALYHAAIEQVSHEAQKYDFLESVNVRPVKQFGWSAAALMVVLAAFGLVLPYASWNSFVRWIEPVAGVERYTMVLIDGLPKELIVAHGEPFDISGKVEYRSFWKPGSVFGWFGKQVKMETPVKSDQFLLHIPGQVENGVLNVEVGDASAQIRILPNHRPSLEELAASIHLPDYLHYPMQSEAVQNGILRTVEGSKVSFLGTISRPLAAAAMKGGVKDQDELAVKGPTFSSEPASASGTGELTFNWRDNLGLTNAAPWHLSVQEEKDEPPVPDLPELPRVTAILSSDVLHIRETAQDDFGVRDLGLSWDLVSDTEQKDSMSTEVKVELPTAQEKSAENTFNWSPSLYRIPADSTVAVQGFSRDYFPKRERARTASYVVHIMSPEAHAEMLRQELEALMAQIEDVTRLQEKIVADTKDVKETASDTPAAQQAAKLSQSKDDQLQNAQHLDALAKQVENTVREAMKNPVIPEDTIRKWSQTSDQWQKLAGDKMQEAARAMETASQDAKSQPSLSSPSSSSSSSSQSGQSGQSTPPKDAKAQEEDQKKREQEMAEAQKRAEEVLAALRKMEQNANKNLDDLQALTLAERLRRVGNSEQNLGGELTSNLVNTIGLPPEELPDKFKRQNTVYVKEQVGAHDESKNLQSEISRFYERTQKAEYGGVAKSMKEANVADEMDRLGGLIQSNITVQTSLDLTNWSGRFHKWADDLQPKGGGGGGGGGQSLDLTQQLIALLRLRGKESNLRDETGVLEFSKTIMPDYKDQAGTLSTTQGNLGEALELIHKATPVPQFDPNFKQINDSMGQAKELLAKPQTDALTDGAEARSVDQISDLVNLINEKMQGGASQQPGQDPGSAEEMAFLTKMMRAKGPPGSQPPPPGGTGGGNTSGGNTDRTGHGVVGDVTGQKAGTRNVSKAAGAIQNSPAEFRDALENYFHSVEKP